jgi:hypothetical protein
MPDRSERDLRNCPIFSEPDVSLSDHRENMPRPRPGEFLLSDTVGSETFVFPYEKWFPDDHDRLGFFAMLFQERARDLVRVWLRTHDKPENFVYAVGFLYRHSIELYLKDIVARSTWFRGLSLKAQRTAIDGHGLRGLWERAKPVMADYVEDDEAGTFEKQLVQLDELDKSSDGFRYPFRFSDREGNRKPVLEGMAYRSFDNLVWILDGLCSWLATTADMEQQYRDYLKEIAQYTR